MTAPVTAAKEQGTEVLGTATEQAGTVVNEAKEQAATVVQEVTAQAKDLTGQVRQQATEQLDTQSQKVQEGLRSLSSQLSSGDTSGIVGQVLEEAGQRLQALSDYVERVGPEGLARDARSYARRNPGTFLLGSALAGLVSGRVLKGISAPRNAGSSTPPAPAGTAAGNPLAGISQEGMGAASGYVATPYPESSYQPGPSLFTETRNGGSL